MRSLRSHLFRAVLFPVGFLVAGLFVVGLANQEQVAELAVTPAPPSRVEVLVERHGCWSGAAPADMVGRVPGHVVLTWPGGSGPSYGGADAVSVALAHVFGNERRGMVVHAFCR